MTDGWWDYKNEDNQKRQNLLLYYHNLEDLLYEYDNIGMFHSWIETEKGKTFHGDIPEEFSNNLRHLQRKDETQK